MRLKKLSAGLLLAALCLALAPAAAASDVLRGTNGDNITWTLSEDGTLTVSGEGAVELTVTDGVYGFGWSDCREQVRRIVVEEGVASLGVWAFTNLTNAESVTLPEGLTEIGVAAFSGCSAMKSVRIPASVTRIDEWAFGGCTALETVDYAGTDAQWDAVAIGGFNQFLTLARDGEVTGEAGALTWRLTRDGVLTVSGDGSLGYVGDWRDLTGFVREVVLEEGVAGVEPDVFDLFAVLTAAELPASLRTIGKNAFWGCGALRELRYHGTAADWARVAYDRNDPVLSGAAVVFLDGGETPADAAALLAAEAPDPLGAARVLQGLVGLGE